MSKAICVYCSSSDAVDTVFVHAAELLGAAIADRGWSLVYGGAKIGLMGRLARSVRKNGGRVVGVIPESISDHGLAFLEADELMMVDGLRERKRIMEELSSDFVALPGGFGTHEELLEILTLKQLHMHNKAVVILNIDNFFDPLLELFDHLYARSFAKYEHKNSYSICDNISSTIDYLEGYVPVESADKWF